MKKKLLATLLTLTLSLGLLAGCGSTEAASDSQSTDTQAESDDDTIVINTCLATGMTGAVNNFAIEKGLYKELGIEFNNVEWSSNDEVLSLITRGEIDFADGDPSAYIPGISNGVPAKLVGNMWRYSGLLFRYIDRI